MKIFILNKKKIIFLCILIFSAIAFAGINTIVSVSKKSSSEIPIYSVMREDNKIALTFNCAWGNEDIPQILEILKNHNIKSTFFVVGEWAEKYPDDLKKIDSAGHEIGSHSYSHAHYKEMSYNDILKDMDKCDNAIEKTINKNISLIRAGYGEYDNEVLKACKNSGRTYIQWSVDSLDYKAENADSILKRVSDKTNAGDIILMHTGTAYTASALDSMLSVLEKHYSFVPVSELIYKDNFIIDNSGKQILNQ